MAFVCLAGMVGVDLESGKEEVVKEGAMDVKQAEAFADLYLKRRGRGQVLELVP